MTIRDYAKSNNFLSNEYIDSGDYIVFSSNIQNLIKSNMLHNHGDLEFRSMYYKDEEHEIFDIDFILDALYNLYKINEYKYTGLYKTTVLDYNPIENYNMVENGSDTSHSSGTNINDIGSQNSTSSETVKISPYDTSDFTNNNESNSAINTSARSDLYSSEGNVNTTHNLNRTGNIGVTTTQQMIESERKVLEMRFVDIICKDIIKYMALRVY